MRYLLKVISKYIYIYIIYVRYLLKVISLLNSLHDFCFLRLFLHKQICVERERDCISLHLKHLLSIVLENSKQKLDTCMLQYHSIYTAPLYPCETKMNQLTPNDQIKEEIVYMNLENYPTTKPSNPTVQSKHPIKNPTKKTNHPTLQDMI